MSRIAIGDLEIAYELIGAEGAPAVALTPGGRFSKDTPGLRELAEQLADGGRRVLIWDRPNCGASDVHFDAPDESSLHADTLVGLIKTLGLGPTTLAAGSAGSRVSLIAASRAPEAISHLVLWWISGGPLGLMMLAGYCCGASAKLTSMDGMKAVAESPAWSEQIAHNPRNRQIILGQDPDVFVETMQRWAAFYIPSSDTPVPGLSRDQLASLSMPVLILRNGLKDLSHPRATSDWLHELIPQSKMHAPPWGEDEWNLRTKARDLGQAPGLFINWPLVAPQILDFVKL
jgi:pimeloyl-ACP methyl ester carboxylesterase